MDKKLDLQKVWKPFQKVERPLKAVIVSELLLNQNIS